MGKVTMRHPLSGVVQQASSEAFDRVWSAEGWQLAEAPAYVGPVEPESPAPDGMPSGMSVAATLEWVGDDPERAREALGAETADGGKNRATLVARLEAVIG